jgi:hypothetical protein
MISGTMPRKRAPGRPRKWGGRREGAGGKPLAGIGASKVAITVLASHIEKVEAWMERHDVPNFSAAVRDMVDLADRVDRSTT